MTTTPARCSAKRSATRAALYHRSGRASRGWPNQAGIPLIVDNTTATPYLCRPIEHGATLVVHSATKYLTGNGTVTGGVVVDSRQVRLVGQSASSPRCPSPNPPITACVFHPALGAMAFTFHSIAVGLRDLGMTMNPQGAHYTLMGIETLGLRMQRHVENAQIVAEWLEQDPRVEFVTYPGLKSSPYHNRAKMIVPKGAGALFTFAMKGGYEACVKLVDNLKLFSHVANLGDTRSLIIHSASTTHRQLSDEQQVAAGAAPNVVRAVDRDRGRATTSSPIWIRRWRRRRHKAVSPRDPVVAGGAAQPNWTKNLE